MQELPKDEQPQRKLKRAVYKSSGTGSEIIVGLGPNSRLRREVELKRKETQKQMETFDKPVSPDTT